MLICRDLGGRGGGGRVGYCWRGRLMETLRVEECVFFCCDIIQLRGALSKNIFSGCKVREREKVGL